MFGLKWDPTLLSESYVNAFALICCLFKPQHLCLLKLIAYHQHLQSTGCSFFDAFCAGKCWICSWLCDFWCKTEQTLCEDVILKSKNRAEIIKSPTISAQWAGCVWLWCRCCSSVERLDAVWAESQLSHTSFQVSEQISGWTNGNSVVSERVEAKLLVGIKMKLFAHETVMKCVHGEGEQFA